MNHSAKTSLDVTFVGETKLSRTQEKLPQNLGAHITKGGLWFTCIVGECEKGEIGVSVSFLCLNTMCELA